MASAPQIVTAAAGSPKALPENPESLREREGVTESWRPLWWLPCELSVQVPIRHFTVGELLRLRPATVVSSGWSRSAEVPLHANGQRVGSIEFEAVGEHVGARITELV